MSWLTKHTRNLLKDMPIDNIGSALRVEGEDINKKRTNPNATRTDIDSKEQKNLKNKDALIAAERKRLRDTKDPVLKKQSVLVKTIKDIGKYGK
jgi:hypothetical protein